MTNLEDIPDYIWDWICEHPYDGVYRFPEGVLTMWNGRIAWDPKEDCPKEGR